MAKKGTNYAKLGFKVLEWVRPVVYYGFIPVVIIIGMRTEPRPRCAARPPVAHRVFSLARARAAFERSRAPRSLRDLLTIT